MGFGCDWLYSDIDWSRHTRVRVGVDQSDADGRQSVESILETLDKAEVIHLHRVSKSKMIEVLLSRPLR